MAGDREVRCSNCGAPLGPEDGFCGDCGAPRPAPAQAAPAEPEPLEPVFRPENPPPLPGAYLSPRRRTLASLVAMAAILAAVVLCSFGLVLAFFAPDPELGTRATTDMVAGSAILCFCPGTIALAVAIVLWTRVLRRR